MIIVVDFDGSCVKHEYPLVGADIGAIPVLKEIVENGHNLILFTMRDGKELEDATKWFADNGIELYGVQENPPQKEWTTSPKAYGQLYIDDAALGCPVIVDDCGNCKGKGVMREGAYGAGTCTHCFGTGKGRVYIDWKEVRRLLILKKILK